MTMINLTAQNQSGPPPAGGLPPRSCARSRGPKLSDHAFFRRFRAAAYVLGAQRRE